MFMARRSLLIAVLVAVGLAVAPAQVRAEDFSKNAETFVRGLADRAIQALTPKDITRKERIERFRKLLHDSFDVPVIGRWVLGRYWDRASKDEQDEYMRLFEDLIVVTYVDRFAEYTGESLKVGESSMLEPTVAVVKSEITQSVGEPVRVEWRLRAPGGNLKIVDVLVNGTSMSVTQRSDFGSVINRNGGEIKGLLTALRDRTKSLNADSN